MKTKRKKVTRSASVNPRKTKNQLIMESYEQQARARAAWGLFGAVVRQSNFNNELRRCKNDEERRALIEKGQRQNARGFYIG